MAVLMLFSTVTFAQVGINTDSPKATLDVTASVSDLSKTDGFIAPRLKGSELKAKDTLYTSGQDAAIVYVTEALAAADVTDITTNVTSIGYYYFDKTIGTAGRWTKFSYQEPWNVQGGSMPATINTQNIYQSGSVAINRSTVYDGSTVGTEATDTSGQAKLDVMGSVRFGARQRGTVGINSIVAGAENNGSGNNVAVFGGANTSNAGYSLVAGFNNSAAVSGAGGQIIVGHNNSLLTGTGQDNAIFGYTNSLSAGTGSLIAGSRNVITGGSNSITAGLSNTVSGGDNKLVMGTLNTVTSGDNSAVFGSSNTVSALSAITAGSNNTNSGQYTIVGGINNKVAGLYGVAFGKGNVTGTGLTSISGYASLATGENNQIDQVLSLVNGYQNSLSGTANTGTNFVSGRFNTIVNASWSGVIGDTNSNYALSSFIAGGSNIIGSSTNTDPTAAQYSVVGGYKNTTAAPNTFVAGSNNTLSSAAQSAFVGGTRNTTTAGYSFAAGVGNTLSNTASSALGKYNLDFTGAYFTIGNGYSVGGGVTTLRSNAFAIIANNIDSNSAIADAWVAIGSNTTVPTRTGTEKLKVYGSIQTAGNSYPDYVFEDYFNGSSKINSDYQFKSLYDTEKYIKDNHHLPGVTSIKDLEKTENGYSFNLTELSTQTLEKVEELYLHTIEQQKQIDELKEMVKTQQEQIKQLIK